MACLLALDLDGTTVNRQGKLGDATRNALMEARRRGNTIVFATGRRDMDMFSFWEDSRCADYLLLNNGSKLMRTDTRQVLFNHTIPADICQNLICKCLKENWQLHIFSHDYWSVNKWSDGLQEYVEYLGTKPILYHALEETPWQQVEGFMATADLNPICDYIRSQGLPLEYTPSEDTCVDIMDIGISKWGGIQELMDLLQIPVDHVIAAGDYNNDIPMIQGAKIGIAVANALPEVKAAADYVTQRTCNQDAVAEIIERFIL